MSNDKISLAAESLILYLESLGIENKAMADLRAAFAAALEQPKPNMLAFVDAIFNGAFEAVDFTGADIQEMGVKYGLLKAYQATEHCGDDCACACLTDFPTECYRTTYRAAPPERSEQPAPQRDDGKDALPNVIQLSDACEIYEGGSEVGRPELGMLRAFKYLRNATYNDDSEEA